MTENADTHKGEDTHDEVGIEIMKGAHKEEDYVKFLHIPHKSLQLDMSSRHSINTYQFSKIRTDQIIFLIGN